MFMNQTQFHEPPLIEIPDLPSSKLCPVRALKDYLAGTKETSLRFHPVSGKSLNAGRLAYFLAKAIRWLVPDVKARGHDTRRISTTNAFCAGASASQIVAAGSWRSHNTCAKRYFVPETSSSKNRLSRHVVELFDEIITIKFLLFGFSAKLLLFHLGAIFLNLQA